MERFLDAAIELVNESGTGNEFTVQDVVDRSEQSLRSFYQYFGGKHELLLAVFEESIRTTTEVLREKIAEEDDVLERLHRFVIEYYRMCRPAKRARRAAKGPGPIMVEFAQQLFTAHPTEAAGAFVPLVSLFEEVLDEAAEAGVVRAGLRRRRVAGVILEEIMFNAFSSTIGGVPIRGEGVDDAEELWDLILHGIGAGRP